ncbi:MAG: type II toxin-antitoxin system VapC family toxin [Acidobacteria bacterium]|nr:type II toxin-antitoxin system VapC family toxin [Acidobacteriota bacterium]
MILVDTSIWIDHLRSTNAALHTYLQDGSVMTHELVIQELACGHIKGRREVIGMLQSLPVAPVATPREVLNLIERKGLHGVGLGAIDVHLIASALLAKAKIWSRDKALLQEAGRLGLAV